MAPQLGVFEGQVPCIGWWARAAQALVPSDPHRATPPGRCPTAPLRASRRGGCPPPTRTPSSPTCGTAAPGWTPPAGSSSPQVQPLQGEGLLRAVLGASWGGGLGVSTLSLPPLLRLCSLSQPPAALLAPAITTEACSAPGSLPFLLPSSSWRPPRNPPFPPHPQTMTPPATPLRKSWRGGWAASAAGACAGP